MDGNGRWALARGLPRTAGHAAGIEAVRRVVDAAPEAGIAVLTLFAFSADNWRRPGEEVGALMRLLVEYLEAETERAAANGVRVEVIGRRDRLDAAVESAIGRAERATAGCGRLRLRVAVDYSARDAILAAARGLREFSLEAFGEASGARRRPADPHRRGAAAQRFSAVGKRVRGAGFHAHDVAGFRGGGSGGGAGGVSRARPAVRGSAGAGAATGGVAGLRRGGDRGWGGRASRL